MPKINRERFDKHNTVQSIRAAFGFGYQCKVELLVIINTGEFRTELPVLLSDSWILRAVSRDDERARDNTAKGLA